MIRATSAALFLFLVSATGAVCWLAYDAHKLLTHLDGVAVRAEGIETKANATLVNLDKGTAVWAASAKDQAGAVQDLATDAHGTLGQVNTLALSMNQSAIDLHTNLTALHKTVDAATDLTVALTTDARTANSTIAAGKPLLEASTLAVQHFDAVVQSPDLSRALSHANGMTESGDAILADFRKVADKETADWLKPVPWWKKPIAKTGQLIDIGAAVARHTP